MLPTMIRTLLTTGLLAWLASGMAADIGISPPRVDLAGAPGQRLTTTVTVLTMSGREQQVATEIGDWTMGVTGDIAFFPSGTLTHSSGPWFELDALDFVLQPGGGREVRLDVTIPEDAEGTHHAMVFFTVVPPPTEASGIAVVTTSRVAFTVYVTVSGTEVNGAELLDLYQSGADAITAVLVNTGNTVMRLGGVVELRNEAGEVVRRLEVPDVPVLRESERELTFTLPDDLPSGFYVALALIEDSRGGILAGELAFDVP